MMGCKYYLAVRRARFLRQESGKRLEAILDDVPLLALQAVAQMRMHCAIFFQ